MLNLLKLRIKHGYQAIPDIRTAKLLPLFRGFPEIKECGNNANCKLCAEICPSHAIELNPLRIDMGKCIFCGECEKACPEGSIKFTNEYRLGNTQRENLVIKEGSQFNDYDKLAIDVKKEIAKIFGRSLKLRKFPPEDATAAKRSWAQLQMLILTWEDSVLTLWLHRDMPTVLLLQDRLPAIWLRH